MTSSASSERIDPLVWRVSSVVLLVRLDRGAAGHAAVRPRRHRDSPTLLSIALFVRGWGLGSISIPSLASAYATVPRPQVPSATTALNVVQRLGGPSATTLLALFLQSRLLAAPHPAAFAATFGLLCTLHAAVALSASRLPSIRPV